MQKDNEILISDVIGKHHQKLLADWFERQRSEGSLTNGRLDEREVTDHSRRFLGELRKGSEKGSFDGKSVV